MRHGLTLLMTIVFILLLGTIVGLTLSSFSTTTAKATHQYLYKQAQILAQSAVEYAILAVQGHLTTNNCVKQVNINYNNTFDLNVTIHYIGNNLPTNCPILYNNLRHNESNLTLLMDVSVTLNPAIQATEPEFRYVRRSIEKL